MRDLLSIITVLAIAGEVASTVPGGYKKKCDPPLVWKETSYGGKCVPCEYGTEYFEGICRPIPPICPPPLVLEYNKETNSWTCDKPIPPPCLPPLKLTWDDKRGWKCDKPEPPICKYGEVPVWYDGRGWACEKKPSPPTCSLTDWSYLVGGKYDAKAGTITLKDGRVVKLDDLHKPNRVLSEFQPKAFASAADVDPNRLTIIVKTEGDCVNVIDALCR